MAIKLLIRQFPRDEIVDEESGEVTLGPEKPIELYYLTSEAWWVRGFGREKLKNDLILETRQFVRKEHALRRDIRLTLEEYKKYHCAGRYDPDKGTVCILSTDQIPLIKTIQEKKIIDEGPPPVIDLIEKKINPLHLLIENLLDERNTPISKMAEDKQYQERRVWPAIENVKTELKGALEVAKGNINKVLERDEKIEVLNEKAEQIADSALQFYNHSHELANQGCWGAISRALSRMF